MGMLDRYKKKGGFLQLLNLLETTPQPKRDKFFALIAEESTAWEAELKKKILTIDRMFNWSNAYLLEILKNIPASNIAYAVFEFSTDQRELFLSSLGHLDRKKADEILQGNKPPGGEILTCQMKILNEVRNQVSSSQLKLDKVDPELTIPDNIEETLNSIVSSTSTGASLSSNGLSIDKKVQEEISKDIPANLSEELMALRKKVMVLSQENIALSQQNQVLKGKLDQIKKIA